MLSEFNWQLIIIIILLSAAVSYIGDVLGMKLGRKRISFLGLRPKYTSRVITLFTGVGVAVITLVFAVSTSDSVRGAFFAAKLLERQVSQLTESLNLQKEQLEGTEYKAFTAQQDLAEAERNLLSTSKDLAEADLRLKDVEAQAAQLNKEKKELGEQLAALRISKASTESDIAKLRQQSEQLAKSLTEMKGGRLMAFQGELLAQTSIESSATASDIDAALGRLTHLAAEALTLKALGTGNKNTPAVFIDEEMRKKTTAKLASASGKGRKVLRLTAAMNVVYGQPVNGVVNIFQSKLVFAKDSILTSGTVQGGLPQDRVADELYSMLKKINSKAVKAGVLPDPLSGAVGNLDSMHFYSAAAKISEAEGDQTVSFLAAKDIYTEGPVDIRIDVIGKDIKR